MAIDGWKGGKVFGNKWVSSIEINKDHKVGLLKHEGFFKHMA